MLDIKMYTFLTLCDTMNYRKAAEKLNMTQPAVTQHIKAIENYYKCRLFDYKGRRLSKTPSGVLFEKYARTASYNEQMIRRNLPKPEKIELRIGATRTIGTYMLGEKLSSLVKHTDIAVTLMVDNTEVLLHMLNKGELDIALIEGFFDKGSYDYKLLRMEPFVGICSREHKFACRDVSLKDIFDETIIMREKGSGTRAIFEQVLSEYNYTAENFKKAICINNFEAIKQLVKNNCGISFVYKVISDSDINISTFGIESVKIKREFNFVWLKGTQASGFIRFLE